MALLNILILIWHNFHALYSQQISSHMQIMITRLRITITELANDSDRNLPVFVDDDNISNMTIVCWWHKGGWVTFSTFADFSEKMTRIMMIMIILRYNDNNHTMNLWLRVIETYLTLISDAVVDDNISNMTNLFSWWHKGGGWVETFSTFALSLI